MVKSIIIFRKWVIMSYNELKMHGTADFPIELYHIDKTYPNYEMSSHWHSEIEIIRVIEGSMNIKLNNKLYPVSEGDIIFVNTETVHGAEPIDCVYECIDFHIEFLAVENSGCKYFVEEILNNEISVFETVDRKYEEYYSAVDEVFSLMKNKSSGYKFKVIGALYYLFGVIIDNHLYHQVGKDLSVAEDKSVAKLKNVLSYIRSNYDSQITLNDISTVAEMSPKYFCSYFRNMTRRTPIEYLNAYRIEKASRKLLGTDMSVTDIAFSCGFNDLSYFIKTFKEIKGITPAKFRKGS